MQHDLMAELSLFLWSGVLLECLDRNLLAHMQPSVVMCADFAVGGGIARLGCALKEESEAT